MNKFENKMIGFSDWVTKTNVKYTSFYNGWNELDIIKYEHGVALVGLLFFGILLVIAGFMV